MEVLYGEHPFPEIGQEVASIGMKHFLKKRRPVAIVPKFGVAIVPNSNLPVAIVLM